MTDFRSHGQKLDYTAMLGDGHTTICRVSHDGKLCKNSQ